MTGSSLSQSAGLLHLHCARPGSRSDGGAIKSRNNVGTGGTCKGTCGAREFGAEYQWFEADLDRPRLVKGFNRVSFLWIVDRCINDAIILTTEQKVRSSCPSSDLA